MLHRRGACVPVLVGLLLFGVALGVLRAELHAVSWHELIADVAQLPRPGSCSALVLTALNYAVLTGYDFLAFAYIGKRLPRGDVALASFLAYAIANNVGFAMLSGASVRYRFYTRWGVTAEELSRIVFSYSVTFWLGLLALGGVSLAVSPLPARRDCRRRRRRAGRLAAGASAAAYVAAAAPATGPISRRRFGSRLPLAALRRHAAQLLSSLDWALAGAVLYVLLPPAPCRSWRSSARSSPPSCSAWPATCPAASASSRG